MAMNPIPPQAYTKETLLQAFQWLQDQDPSIREIATTPDLLVSLYLKANRDGMSALNRPSIQNFKSELKTLSAMMGSLEKPKPSAPVTVKQTQINDPTSQQAPIAQPQLPQHQIIDQPKSVVATALAELDERSLLAIKNTKEMLNLGSDNEALRYLIQVGYAKSKSFIS